MNPVLKTFALLSLSQLLCGQTARAFTSPKEQGQEACVKQLLQEIIHEQSATNRDTVINSVKKGHFSKRYFKISASSPVWGELDGFVFANVKWNGDVIECEVKSTTWGYRENYSFALVVHGQIIHGLGYNPLAAIITMGSPGEKLSERTFSSRQK